MTLLILYIVLSLLISRFIIKSTIFNIANISLISYWAAYPLENLSINNTYLTINGIKERGIYLYTIFGLSFLLGVFLITKLNPKKVSFFASLNSKNNLFFVSILLGFLGLICFSYILLMEKNASNFWRKKRDQVCTDFWHNLYIRRSPGPSPKPLEGFQPTFSKVFQYFRGENLPEKN